MRILSTVWALFEENSFEVQKNGGSIMIYDICQYIGKKVESYVFIGNTKMPQKRLDDIIILNNQRYLPVKRNSKTIDEWHNGLQMSLKENLKKLSPDLVLVHGGLDFSTKCIYTCREMNVSYAYVDHLMQSGNAGYKMKKAHELWEKKLLSIPDIKVIAVGNGMRRKLLEENSFLSEEQVCAIPNGVPKNNIIKPPKRIPVFDNNLKKLICVGSIQQRKNQIQLIDAYLLLPDRIRDSLQIIIVGSSKEDDPYKIMLEKKIIENGLKNRIIYIGEYGRDEMPFVYNEADGLIMPSMSEGLSLVVLEMLSYGKPVIMFSDNETAEDISDEKVVSFANSHTDKSLSEAIVEWFDKEWDEDYIKSYSVYYTMERVADDYIRYCKTMKRGRKNADGFCISRNI